MVVLWSYGVILKIKSSNGMQVFGTLQFIVDQSLIPRTVQDRLGPEVLFRYWIIALGIQGVE